MDAWPEGWPQSRRSRDSADQLRLLGAVVAFPLLFLLFHALMAETQPARLVRGSKARAVGWNPVGVSGRRGLVRRLRQLLGLRP